jgi:hypothetical protein
MSFKQVRCQTCLVTHIVLDKNYTKTRGFALVPKFVVLDSDRRLPGLPLPAGDVRAREMREEEFRTGRCVLASGIAAVVRDSSQSRRRLYESFTCRLLVFFLLLTVSC